MDWEISAEIIDQAVEVGAAADAEESGRQEERCASPRVCPVTAARGFRDHCNGTVHA
jgi:hypothetical protein